MEKQIAGQTDIWGEKSVGEKSVGETSLGENFMADKYVGTETLWAKGL